jgi:TPR repeat protein
MMRHLLSIVFVLTLLPSIAVLAADSVDDFADGAQAYDGGRITAALDAWWRAAARGHTGAMTALANVYLYGERVTRDPSRAVAWYRKAAERGDVTAQLNLGDLYRRGLGVPKNKIKNYIWLSLAATQGNEWALATKRKLTERMSTQEQRQAEASLHQQKIKIK